MSTELFAGAATSIEALRLIFPAFHITKDDEGYVRASSGTVDITGYGPGTVHLRMLTLIEDLHDAEPATILKRGFPRLVFSSEGSVALQVGLFHKGTKDVHKLICSFTCPYRTWAFMDGLLKRLSALDKKSDELEKPGVLAPEFASGLTEERAAVAAHYDWYRIPAASRVWGIPPGFEINVTGVPLR